MRSIRIFAKNMGDPYYEPTIVVHDTLFICNSVTRAQLILSLQLFHPFFASQFTFLEVFEAHSLLIHQLNLFQLNGLKIDDTNYCHT